MDKFFRTRLESLALLGSKAALLNTELGLFTYADLIQYYPYRYEDKQKVWKIAELNETMPYAQFIGRITDLKKQGFGKGKERLIATVIDETGTIELVWFQGLQWLTKKLNLNDVYLFYGKPSIFNRRLSLTHPEMKPYTPGMALETGLTAIYTLTEKLRKRGIDHKVLGMAIKSVLELAGDRLQESLPEYVTEKYKLCSKAQAYQRIHRPNTEQEIYDARRRLKFEELFYTQLKMFSRKHQTKVEHKGLVLNQTELLNLYYKHHIPFQLTGAQKKVVKEIFADMKSGDQMNRLLQGDVGSGKTMVAFISALIAISSETQSCIIAPTEILSEQHFRTIAEWAYPLGVKTELLTGSTPKRKREELLARLAAGDIDLLIGTHALLEERVKFRLLGLCVIDEQHRFGVAQRARMWEKNYQTPPHLLVMTATPIPRTLAMTLYGDLDVSVIDELPPGRTPIKTVHRNVNARNQVFEFMRHEISHGRQVYVVFPLIEESSKLDFANLMEGMELIKQNFPEPEYRVSMVHGQMPNSERDAEMERFLKKESHIMVATTVIEVGVNIPNATIMVIESAERFGLSQLHQLRGRVGRGAQQSYCILLTGLKLSRESRTRMETMVRTTNGFEISEVDMRLRGPGDMMGTKQSGMIDFLIADLSTDTEILKEASGIADKIVKEDPYFIKAEHLVINRFINSFKSDALYWSRIS